MSRVIWPDSILSIRGSTVFFNHTCDFSHLFLVEAVAGWTG